MNILFYFLLSLTQLLPAGVEDPTDSLSPHLPINRLLS